MNRILIPILFFIFSSGTLYSQCYQSLGEASGIDIKSNENDLIAAACSIQAAFASYDSIAGTNYRDSFHVFDIGFYVHNPLMQGYPAIWEKAKQNAASKSPYYLLFGKQSDADGIYTKFWVDVRLPKTGVFSCFETDHNEALIKQLEAAIAEKMNHPLDYAKGEIRAMEVCRWSIKQIIDCDCHLLSSSRSRGNCELCPPAAIVPSELIGKGFEPRTVTRYEALSGQAPQQDGIVDLLNAKLDFEQRVTDEGTINLTNISIADEIRPAKKDWDARGILGKVYILQGPKATCSSEWEQMQSEVDGIEDSGVDGKIYHYIECHIFIPDEYGTTGTLYSRFYIPEAPNAGLHQSSSRSFALPLLIPALKALGKAFANGAIDYVLQIFFNRIFAKDWEEARNNASLIGAAWNGFSTLLPWESMGDFACYYKALSDGFAVVLDKATKSPDTYTIAAAFQDMTIGTGSAFLSDYIVRKLSPRSAIPCRTPERLGSSQKKLFNEAIAGLDKWHASSSTNFIKIAIEEISFRLSMSTIPGLKLSHKNAYKTLFEVPDIRNNSTTLSALASDIQKVSDLSGFLKGSIGRVKAWDGLFPSETLRKNRDALTEGDYLLGKGFTKSDLNGFATYVDNAFPGTKSTLTSRINSGSGFNLIHTDDQIQAIMLRAKSLNLPANEIDDLLLVSCRSSKRVTAAELMQQMDNWVNVVKLRGYPYKFTDLKNFQAFGGSLKGKLDDINVSSADVRIQGSSLRTPDANDVDIAVFVDDLEFNNYLRNGFGNNQIRNKITDTKIDVTNMTDSELLNLAQQIQADVNRTMFNSKARTFEFAFTSRKISAKTTDPEIIPGINNLKNSISVDFPNLDIEDVSTFAPGTTFIQNPFINL